MADNPTKVILPDGQEIASPVNDEASIRAAVKQTGAYPELDNCEFVTHPDNSVEFRLTASHKGV